MGITHDALGWSLSPWHLECEWFWGTVCSVHLCSLFSGLGAGRLMGWGGGMSHSTSTTHTEAGLGESEPQPHNPGGSRGLLTFNTSQLLACLQRKGLRDRVVEAHICYDPASSSL